MPSTSKSDRSLETILSTTTMAATCRWPWQEWGCQRMVWTCFVASHYSPSQDVSAPSPNNAKLPFSRCFDSSNAPSTAIAGEDEDDIISFQGREENAFRSPNSHMLSPIMILVTSFDVFRFSKRAEIHAGLPKTQLLDLCWVLIIKYYRF